MEQLLALEMVRVTEAAAIESARFMGRGAKDEADAAATQAMRSTMDEIEFAGRIVIGEGERDEAPMLFIGEKIGVANVVNGRSGLGAPQIDIAVDPLEGTNLCATGAPGAIAVLAASEKGGLLHAPDLYMEKLIVPEPARGKVDLDAPVGDNLNAIAKALSRDVDDLVITVLDRPRHEKLIAEIRASGARIKLIGDGDLSAAIVAAVAGTGVHAVMGTGGAPEGVLTAVAMRCLNGEIYARLVVRTPEDEQRSHAMGISDLRRVYSAADLAPGRHLIFAATGVTEGALMKGVRFFRDGTRTASLVMQTSPRQIRFIDSIHLSHADNATIRF